MALPSGYAFGAKILGACAIAIGLIGFGWWLGGRAGAVEVAELKADHAELLLEIAEDSRKLAAEIRQYEQRVASDIAAIATVYEDQRHEIAENARAAVLDDIRAGRVRLRGYGPRAAVPTAGQAAAGTSQRDGEAAGGGPVPGDLDGEYAERVAQQIAVAEAADAQLAACQAVIRVYTGESAPE